MRNGFWSISRLRVISALASLSAAGAAFAADGPREGSFSPEQFRLAEFAQGLYYPDGQQRLTIVGDSINATNVPNRMIAGYRDMWNIKWNGWVVHADNGASDIGYMNAQNLATLDYSIVWDPGEPFTGGQSRISPVRTREIIYTRPIPASTDVSECMLVPGATSKFPAGDFFRNSRVTARIVLFNDLNMRRVWKVRGYRGGTVVGDSTKYVAAEPYGRLTWLDVDLGNISGAPRIRIFTPPGPILRWRDTERFALAGVLFRATDVPNGVQMSVISHGGWKTQDHAGEGKFVDGALRQYYDAIGTPTHLILWLGQNQTTVEANQLVNGVNTEYKNNLRAVMERHERIIAELGRPAPRWLLVTPYKTGYDRPVHELMVQSMYELSQENTRVSFLNLYALAGGENFDVATYLSDGVHPNYAGSAYLAAIMDGAMRSTLRCLADVDASGFVDNEDFGIFMQWYETSDARADLDLTGFVDTDDLDTFRQAFEAGC